jgi:hypothetical protein
LFNIQTASREIKGVGYPDGDLWMSNPEETDHHSVESRVWTAVEKRIGNE